MGPLAMLRPPCKRPRHLATFSNKLYPKLVAYVDETEISKISVVSEYG
jgi:hypothetical protein